MNLLSPDNRSANAADKLSYADLTTGANPFFALSGGFHNLRAERDFHPLRGVKVIYFVVNLIGLVKLS